MFCLIIMNLINRPVGWSQSGFYLVQLDDGLRAAGTVEIAGLHKQANKKRTKMIESQARKLLPQLKEVKSTWMGFRPTTTRFITSYRSITKK